MATFDLLRFFNPDDIPGKKTFHFSDTELVHKINVAIAIGRPLLLTGSAGIGKSSVARGIVDALGWAPFQKTITSRMDAAELKADFDAVGRLSDASGQTTAAELSKERYLTPGIIWQAYDSIDARAFLKRNEKAEITELMDERLDKGRVLLIDEIDKGDLDFANDLLDVFADGKFTIPVIGGTVERRGEKNLLVVITSNGERDLSSAFLRRCIPHRMVAPGLADAVEIGNAHLMRSEMGKDMRSEIGKEMRSSVLNPERLGELATFTPSMNEAGRAAIDVAQFIDLIDATLKFQPREADWPEFANAIRAFAKSRRDSSLASGQL